MSTSGAPAEAQLIDDLTKLLNEYGALHRQALQDASRSHSEMTRTRQGMGQVVHDLRTPLTTITGLSELLLDEQLTDRQRHMVTRIAAAADQIHELSRELLVTVTSARTANPLVPVDLVALADSLVSRHQLLGTAHQLRRTHIGLPDGARCRVIGDPLRLERMLDNLVNNAIKYSPPSSTIDITISDHLGDDPGNDPGNDLSTVPDSHADSSTPRRQLPIECRISVTDQGLGIPAADQQRVFDAFHRAANTHGVPGLGLGLTIVDQIARLHGGSVTLTSTPGEGSTFNVTLPAITIA